MEKHIHFLYIFLDIYLKFPRYFLFFIDYTLCIYVYIKLIFVTERFIHLDIIEKKMRICQIEYHLLHSICHLGQKGRIFTVLRGELPG